MTDESNILHLSSKQTICAHSYPEPPEQLSIVPPTRSTISRKDYKLKKQYHRELKVMSRQNYINFIGQKLSSLVTQTKMFGTLNLHDINILSENFYRDLLNLLYGYNLENLNSTQQNVAAIDLIDRAAKMVVQVSVTDTKQKIEESLNKKNLGDYTGWNFKFVLIADDQNELRKKSYRNPYNLNFEPSRDIYDVISIFSDIQNLTIDRLKDVYEFISKELIDPSVPLVTSDLTEIIRILASNPNIEVWTPDKVAEFEIDNKIDYNELIHSKAIINDYKAWIISVQQAYSAFDAQGANKSFFVHQKIRDFYTQNKTLMKGDQLFEKVHRCVVDYVLEHLGTMEISAESLDVCARALVVDAFVQCKIFERPIAD
jgi:hypothetical protein